RGGQQGGGHPPRAGFFYPRDEGWPLMDVDRRELIKASAILASTVAWSPAAFAQGRTALPAAYAEIERRTFLWFWDTVNRQNGLVPDRWPTPSFSSIAAVGFALPAYAIGVEGGWWRRAGGRDRAVPHLRLV